MYHLIVSFHNTSAPNVSQLTFTTFDAMNAVAQEFKRLGIGCIAVSDVQIGTRNDIPAGLIRTR